MLAVGKPRSGRKPGRPFGSYQTGGADMNLLSLLHRGQARIYRGLQMSLIARIESLRSGEDWRMPPDMRAELAEIDTFLAKASAAATKVQETSLKVLEACSTEQLEQQLRSEFVMAANTFSEVEWKILDEVRMKQRMAS